MWVIFIFLTNFTHFINHKRIKELKFAIFSEKVTGPFSSRVASQKTLFQFCWILLGQTFNFKSNKFFLPKNLKLNKTINIYQVTPQLPPAAGSHASCRRPLCDHAVQLCSKKVLQTSTQEKKRVFCHSKYLSRWAWLRPGIIVS